MPSQLDGLKVYIATPCNRDIPVPTVVSYLETQEFCLQHGVRVNIGFMPCSLVHHGRALAAKLFLEGDCDLLFFVDSDMAWEPEEFLRLLTHARKYDCVVGIYPRRQDPPGYFVRFVPEAEPNEDGLIEIEATGLGFACIKRAVIQHLAALAPKLRYSGNPAPSPAIFRCDDDGTSARGEDYAFWADVREAGYKIYADTQTNIGHVGQKVYRRIEPNQPAT